MVLGLTVPPVWDCLNPPNEACEAARSKDPVLTAPESQVCLYQYQYRGECCCQMVVRVFHGQPCCGSPTEPWGARLWPSFL